jgi:enediyne biosynthesis protein E4
MKNILFITILTLILGGCKEKQPLFVLLDSDKTHIDFNNDITENDTLTIFSSEFIYNGGGVAVGDLNGDGLQDLFFTGNQVQNKLYLNKGGLSFEDITQKAQVEKQKGEWSAGVNFLDINKDGKLDIYVCNTFINNPAKRQNLLYINKGNTGGGVPTFQESAAAYGIADTTHSPNAQFFDYDNDGDLDLFLAVNYMDTKYPNQYFPKVKDGKSPNTDKLFRNDFDPSVNHPVFTDVSKKAGILLEGYSHSSLVTDFNNDGWLDIYVANDYVTNDLIYINQKNGTFKNEAATIFKHQAASAMGSDVADVNNDGKLDFFTTEMMPYHNLRKKVFLNPNNYTNYINNESFGFEYQYARNTLQINAGQDPKTGLSVFSDVAFLSDVQETEWSWTPLMADFDNDGNRDIIVTNGFPKDVTDHDFGAYRSTVSSLIPPLQLQKNIPQIKVPKFAFQNKGDLHFEDVSKQWGLDKIGFTNGAAYADFDNDGDLDLVMNNIEDKAFLFKNTLNDDPKAAEKEGQKANFLRIQLQSDPSLNPDAFGATVTAFFNGQQQVAQLLSARGFSSASENIVHFGLGKAQKVDSVVVNWGKFGKQIFTQLPINQLVTLKLDLQKCQNTEGGYLAQNTLFQMLDPQKFGLSFMHRDSDFIDFNFQKTLPHKFSQYGPSLAVGDVNGDKLDDVYVSGAAFSDGTWFFQNKNGTFNRKDVAYKTDPQKREEELGTALFDADRDGDLDMYIVRGGAQHAPQSPMYQDVLLVNDGKGNFKNTEGGIPTETSCGQVVKTGDFDGDGDLDLFVGSRILPFSYPKADRSFILRNDTKEKDKPQFTDVTAQICPEIAQIGMVTDAVWTDFDGDKKTDLVVSGEWMPVTFFKNTGSKLQNTTQQTGIGDRVGWWSSLAAADFDNDGDTDFMAGSFGQNLYFKCTNEHPLSIYAKDFDGNGLYDPFISCYWRDTAGQKQEFFYHTRDDMIKQLILIRRKFQTYGDFGKATVKDVFTPEELKGATIQKANYMHTSYVENLGNSKFKITPLPTAAQLAPIQSILPYDVDNDGKLDLVMVGNDFGMELLQGRADAFNGLIIKNLGNGQFQSLGLNQTGFFVPNDGRAVVKVNSANGKPMFMAAQNRGELKVFARR